MSKPATPPPCEGLSGEAACRNCRRPIQFVTGIGWLHDELPQYAHEPITCDNPQPAGPSASDEWMKCTGYPITGGQLAHGGPCPMHPEARPA